MSQQAGVKLYTAEVLGLAVSLGQWPPRPDARYHGSSRSRSCGSTLFFDCDLQGSGIVSPGIGLHACAIGQASAAIFVRSAAGLNRADVGNACAALEGWLGGNGPAPDVEGLGILEPARAYPARHGAILLPWKAALDALPTVDAGR